MLSPSTKGVLLDVLAQLAKTATVHDGTPTSAPLSRQPVSWIVDDTLSTAAPLVFTIPALATVSVLALWDSRSHLLGSWEITPEHYTRPGTFTVDPGDFEITLDG